MTIDVPRMRVRPQQRLAGAHIPVAVFALATLMLSLFAAGPGVLPGDVAITHWLQGAPDGSVGTLLRVMNAIGETPVILAIGAILAFICVRRRRLDAMLLIAAASMARIANPMLKAFFESPRPTADLVRVDHLSSGWGFPSGHVMGMTLLVGAVVCLTWDAWPRRLSRIATLTVAGLVLLASGAGRIYVGAHWPTDVLGAYCYGSLGTIGLSWCWRRQLGLAFIRSRRSFATPVIAVTDFISAGRPSGAATMVVRRRRINILAFGGLLTVMILFASLAI
jgi:undecaprenyl-diphosphatase